MLIIHPLAAAFYSFLGAALAAIIIQLIAENKVASKGWKEIGPNVSFFVAQSGNHWYAYDYDDPSNAAEGIGR